MSATWCFSSRGHASGYIKAWVGLAGTERSTMVHPLPWEQLEGQDTFDETYLLACLGVTNDSSMANLPLNRAFAERIMRTPVYGQLHNVCVSSTFKQDRKYVRFYRELSSMLFDDRPRLSVPFLSSVVLSQKTRDIHRASLKTFVDLYAKEGVVVETSTHNNNVALCTIATEVHAFRQNRLTETWIRSALLATLLTEPILFYTTFIPFELRSTITRRIGQGSIIFRKGSVMMEDHAMIVTAMYNLPATDHFLGDFYPHGTPWTREQTPFTFAGYDARLQERINTLIGLVDDVIVFTKIAKLMEGPVTSHTLCDEIKRLENEKMKACLRKLNASVFIGPPTEREVRLAHLTWRNVRILCAVQLA